jgi:signal transduction histidine kinase
MSVKTLTTTSIRTRLLVAYVSIILIGFAGLTILAGGQINAAVRTDYNQRLQNEVRLVAQALSTYLTTESTDSSTVTTALQTLSAQVSGELTLYKMGSPDNGNGKPDPDGDNFGRDSFRNMPEMETAIRGDTVVVQRQNDAGEDTLYTAASITSGQRPLGVVQLAVPIQALNNVALQRWAVLIIGCVLLTSLALLAALILSRSIIKPLYMLRESAVKLSKGDFSHRIAYTWKDEIGEVAHAFNEMAGQVQSMLEEQRAFASNTSHELRTPLTAIRLRTEALRTDDTLDEATAHQYIDEIDDEIVHLSDLVQELTLLSRFDAGRAELGHSEIDMVRLAQNLIKQITPTAQEKQIGLSLDAPAEPVLVYGSLSHLTVVFRNLLDNALKYTPNGGTIAWRITKTATGTQHVIHDNGQGIGATHLPHLFERFYRADKARSRDIPGTGLGLSLVKSIVDAYGGQITVTSDGVGKGTVVTVFWPDTASPITPSAK